MATAASSLLTYSIPVMAMKVEWVVLNAKKKTIDS